MRDRCRCYSDLILIRPQSQTVSLCLRHRWHAWFLRVERCRLCRIIADQPDDPDRARLVSISSAIQTITANRCRRAVWPPSTDTDSYGSGGRGRYRTADRWCVNDFLPHSWRLV